MYLFSFVYLFIYLFFYLLIYDLLLIIMICFSQVVESVIIKEKPDGVLVSMGGQTALNCGVALHQAGVFEKYGVVVLGTQIPVIMATEDRDVFGQKLREIDEKLAQSICANTMEEALAAADKVWCENDIFSL